MWAASPISESKSVVSPRADTTRAILFPSRSLATIFAACLIRCGFSSDVPPNFITSLTGIPSDEKLVLDINKVPDDGAGRWLSSRTSTCQCHISRVLCSERESIQRARYTNRIVQGYFFRSDGAFRVLQPADQFDPSSRRTCLSQLSLRNLLNALNEHVSKAYSLFENPVCDDDDFRRCIETSEVACRVCLGVSFRLCLAISA